MKKCFLILFSIFVSNYAFAGEDDWFCRDMKDGKTFECNRSVLKYKDVKPKYDAILRKKISNEEYKKLLGFGYEYRDMIVSKLKTIPLHVKSSQCYDEYHNDDIDEEQLVGMIILGGFNKELLNEALKIQSELANRFKNCEKQLSEFILPNLFFLKKIKEMNKY